ncbi:MAG: tRNA uridine-5-carboxymethylaminomethyl(34) synthesis GTPase MnmE, partial [Clostridia bacterium]
IVDECIKLGARPAERGEFTRRAFLNGKMDLADAEGVIDMINADSEVAVNAAYHLMSGHLSLKVKQIQRQLLEVITDLEAVLDYPEELEDEVLPNTPNEIINIKAKLKEIVELQKYGKYIRSGINIAIVGETNAGKSSLLNALINDERAIVSDIRGTTRDTISESLEYRGIKLNFIDTAGIRETDDIIEKEGVKRAKNSALSSDLVIYLIDLADKRATVDDNLLNEFKTKKLIKVFNKIDISNNIIDQCTNEKADKNSFFVSAKTKEGVAELLNAIVQMFEAEKLTSGAAMTNERQNFAVKKAYESICFALENFNDISTDCTLISLKEAWSLLGEITGETVTEDIVDNIFDKFCVGK